MLSFKGETLNVSLLSETDPLLRRRDVIHRGPALFPYMIHVSLSVIIPLLKKKALIFDLPRTTIVSLQRRPLR